MINLSLGIFKNYIAKCDLPLAISYTHVHTHTTHTRIYIDAQANSKKPVYILPLRFSFLSLSPPHHTLPFSGGYWRHAVQTTKADSLLEDLALRSLRIAEVHDLIQQLIDEDKVVSDALFFQLLEILPKHLATFNKQGGVT